MGKGGLSALVHGILNGAFGGDPAIYDHYREEYADDPVAQQQIDVYDGRTEYHVHFKALREALLDRNELEIKEEMTWFRYHYPDIAREEG